MPAKKPDTSITEDQADEFLISADYGKSLWCKRITGLHLKKFKKGGSWRYYYQDATGHRRIATIGRYPAMKPQGAALRAGAWRNQGADVLAEKQQKKKAAILEKAQSEHRLMRDYLETIYTRHQERKKSGIETLGLIKSNFGAFLDRDMASLSRADIMKWQIAKEKEGRAHATLTRAYGALKTMLRHATKQDPAILTHNPLDGITLERPTDAEKARTLSARKNETRRMLSDDEIQALHKGLDEFARELREQRRNSRAHGKPELPDLDAVTFPHWAIPFTYTALYTGFRTGDLYSLTWQEANLRFKRITKTPEKTRHHPEPAQITINMVEPLHAVLFAWWQQQGKPESGLVFPSPITDRRMDKKAHSKPWAHIKRLGGLPPSLTFYALRHHFISVLIARGTPIFTVARLVGHKSTKMIESHYGHLCPESAEQALNLLAESVAPNSGKPKRKEKAK